MKAFLKEVLSNNDGQWDDGRITAFLLILTFILNSIYALYLQQLWSPQNFGIGAGALVAGIGGFFNLRGDK